MGVMDAESGDDNILRNNNSVLYKMQLFYLQATALIWGSSMQSTIDKNVIKRNSVHGAQTARPFIYATAPNFCQCTVEYQPLSAEQKIDLTVLVFDGGLALTCLVANIDVRKMELKASAQL